MIHTGQRQLLCSCLLATACTLAGNPAHAEAASPDLPVWQALEYEQKALWVTAHSRVELVADADDCQLWLLTARSSVASNSEEVELELAARDGRALQRARLSQGKGRRFKNYEFLPEYILRQRRDPPANTKLPPDEWPLTSSKEVAYPPLPDDTVVTDAYALLELAGRFLASEAASRQVAVNTEFNFYLVTMSRSDTPAIKVNYQVEGQAKAVSGQRDTHGVTLQVSPLGEQADKPDFSLLGLHGEISLLFDRDNGLPLQLKGTAPRLGSTEINLVGVTLRDPGQ